MSCNYFLHFWFILVLFALLSLRVCIYHWPVRYFFITFLFQVRIHIRGRTIMFNMCSFIWGESPHHYLIHIWLKLSPMHDVMEFIGHLWNSIKLSALISCEKLYIKSQFIVENILKGMNGNFHVFFIFL